MKTKKSTKKFKNKPGRKPHLLHEDGDRLVIAGVEYSAERAEQLALNIMRAAARVRARRELVAEIRRGLGAL